MTTKTPQRSWTGFVIGLLAVVLPFGGYLLYRAGQKSQRPVATATQQRGAPAERVQPERPPIPPLDETGLKVSGPSMTDPAPPPSAAAIARSLERAEGWLRRHAIRPYAGSGTDSLRLFALEVQCWDRLARAAEDPSVRQRRSNETMVRLEQFVDPARLTPKLGAGGGESCFFEALTLASLCDEYGVNAGPILPLLRDRAVIVFADARDIPISFASLHVAMMEPLGIAPSDERLAQYRMEGVLADRPREVTMGMAQVFGLTQEIFAHTGFARRPFRFTSEGEKTYLHRVLPQLALTYTVFQEPEVSADLLACLALAGMTETYGYREGMRALVARQNADGSFGPAEDGGGRARRLAATSGCLIALSLEAERARGR